MGEVPGQYSTLQELVDGLENSAQDMGLEDDPKAKAILAAVRSGNRLFDHIPDGGAIDDGWERELNPQLGACID